MIYLTCILFDNNHEKYTTYYCLLFDKKTNDSHYLKGGHRNTLLKEELKKEKDLFLLS